MRKIMMIGKIGCGKTTLGQRLTGQDVHYHKTQAIQVLGSDIVDTPGEYLEQKQFYKALIVTAVEADVILLLLSATDEQNAFSPRMSSMFSGKPVIGVITKTDLCRDPERLREGRELLELAGALAVIETGLDDGESLARLADLIETIEIE